MSRDREPLPGETVGQYVRRMRLARQPALKPAELASRMGVVQSTVSRLEKGGGAEPETLGKAALALDLPLATLYRLAGYPGFVTDAHQTAVYAAFRELLAEDSFRPVEDWLRRQGLDHTEVEVVTDYSRYRLTMARARGGPVAPNAAGHA